MWQNNLNTHVRMNSYRLPSLPTRLYTFIHPTPVDRGWCSASGTPAAQFWHGVPQTLLSSCSWNTLSEVEADLSLGPGECRHSRSVTETCDIIVFIELGVAARCRSSLPAEGHKGQARVKVTESLDTFRTTYNACQYSTILYSTTLPKLTDRYTISWTLPPPPNHQGVRTDTA